MSKTPYVYASTSPVRNKDLETLLRQPSETDLREKKSIKVTRCLSSKCTGFYTDKLSESILILCKDPKHDNQKQSAGLVTNRGPTTENRARTRTKDFTPGDDSYRNE